jgi:hydroxymethylglutaryl-CoA lyase
VDENGLRVLIDRLIDAGVYISEALGREPNSRASKAIRTKRAG